MVGTEGLTHAHRVRLMEALPGKLLPVAGWNRSRAGTVLAAVFGFTPTRPPACGLGAVITPTGAVAVDFVKQDGSFVRAYPLGPIGQIVDEVRFVCDAAHLTDVERELTFEEFRKWIKRDFRAISTELSPGEVRRLKAAREA
jgi:hypothetical protein